MSVAMLIGFFCAVAKMGKTVKAKSM